MASSQKGCAATEARRLGLVFRTYRWHRSEGRLLPGARRVAANPLPGLAPIAKPFRDRSVLRPLERRGRNALYFTISARQHHYPNSHKPAGSNRNRKAEAIAKHALRVVLSPAAFWFCTAPPGERHALCSWRCQGIAEPLSLLAVAPRFLFGPALFISPSLILLLRKHRLPIGGLGLSGLGPKLRPPLLILICRLSVLSLAKCEPDKSEHQ